MNLLYNYITSMVIPQWLTDDLVPDDQPLEADQYVVGYGWPAEKTVFPDFFKPETKEWWASEIDAFKQVHNKTLETLS